VRLCFALFGVRIFLSGNGRHDHLQSKNKPRTWEAGAFMRTRKLRETGKLKAALIAIVATIKDFTLNIAIHGR